MIGQFGVTADFGLPGFLSWVCFVAATRSCTTTDQAAYSTFALDFGRYPYEAAYTT
jgi:hypothetical protein